jgi:pentapeptide repeat protein
MANEEHLKVIQKGVPAWNKWRNEHPEIQPDLSKANLRCKILDDERLYDPTLKIDPSDPTLIGIDLHNAILPEIDLTHACLHNADLRGANLSDAKLIGTNFCWAKLCNAILIGADLHRANLNHADLKDADLSKANLERTILVSTTVSGVTFTSCRVYGASAWDLVGIVKDQSNLSITSPGEPVITVDDIEVAQFIYLILNNRAIRRVIDTITSKAVLILGRFSEERKRVLDALRDELRKSEHNYLPIVFDFPPSANQTTIETVKTLANMARFVIADLTDARSVLMELGAIVPAFPSVAVRLLIKKSEHEYGMLDFIRQFRSVVEKTYEYESLEELIASIKENVIGPAEAKVKELRQRN